MSDTKEIGNIVDKYSKKPPKKKIKKRILIPLILLLTVGIGFVGGKLVLNNLFKEMGNLGDEPDGSQTNNTQPVDKKITGEEAEQLVRDKALALLGLDLTGFSGDIKMIDMVDNKGYYEINFYKEDVSLNSRVSLYDKEIIQMRMGKTQENTKVIGMENAIEVAEEFLKKQYPDRYEAIKLENKVSFKNADEDMVEYRLRFNEEVDGKLNKGEDIYITVDAHDGYIQYFKEVTY